MWGAARGQERPGRGGGERVATGRSARDMRVRAQRREEDSRTRQGTTGAEREAGRRNRLGLVPDEKGELLVEAKR